MTVGERIREIRRAHRMRQKVLARLVGISHGAMTNFEKGRRRISLDWLERIADALDTPMANLLSDDAPVVKRHDPRERQLLLAWRGLSKSPDLRADYMRLLEHLGQRRRRKR